MNTIGAIFFDAVGTLIHPEPAAAVVYAEVGKRFGSQYSLETIARRFDCAFQKQEAIDRQKNWVTSEKRERQRWRDIVGEVLDDIVDRDGCFESLYSHFAKPAAWRCEPGTEVLFEELLGRGYRLGLASNFDERLDGLIRDLLPHWGNHKDVDFPVSVVSFAVGYRKPAADFFQIMCRRVGLEAAHVLHVGDDPENDYRGAQAAGLQAILFDPRGRHEHFSGERIGALHEVLNSV